MVIEWDSSMLNCGSHKLTTRWTDQYQLLIAIYYGCVCEVIDWQTISHNACWFLIKLDPFRTICSKKVMLIPIIF